MGENYGRPKNVTNSAGHELVKYRQSQGIVIGDGTQDNLTLGYQKDQTLGLSIDDGDVSFLKLTKDRLDFSDETNSFMSITKNGLVLNDGTDNRLILGVFPDGTIGFIISRTGVDIYDVFR